MGLNYPWEYILPKKVCTHMITFTSEDRGSPPIHRSVLDGINISVACMLVCTLYSHVHISTDEVFSKILKKPSIMQKKMIRHMKPMVIVIGKKQKQFFF